jgi:putative endonuclease
VLYSPEYDRLYIGQTSDLSKRLLQHNSGLSKSTKHNIPWKLIYSEKFNFRSGAKKREKELKSHKGRDYIRNKYVL